MKNYYLFKRQNSKYWYYYLISSSGEKSNAKSTKCTKKWEAEEYVKKLIPFQYLNVHRITFSQYASNFFDRDSIYVQEGKRNNRMSEGYIRLLQNCLKNHLLPYFGNMVLSEIKPQNIREFRIYLSKKDISNMVINRYVIILGIIFKRAYEDQVIAFIPTFNLKSLDTSSQKRIAFTSKDIVDMLHEPWTKTTEIYRKLCIVAACTGMRIGELRGMTLDHLNDGFYHIEFQCHFITKKMEPPKQNSERYIPISGKLENFIRDINTGNLIFKPKKSADKSLAHINVEYNLKKHFTDEILKKKEKYSLTFHSFRHYYRTMCKKVGMDDFLSEKILGHKVPGIMSTYTDVTNDMFLKFIPLQEKIFDMIMTGIIPDELA